MNKVRGCAFGALSLLLGMASYNDAYAQRVTPQFAGIFGDHAVMQRDEPVTVWGTATASQPVFVSLGDHSAGDHGGRHGWLAGDASEDDRRWSLHSVGQSGGREANLNDIMVGDVYLCGGQSNMEFPARLSAGAWGDFPANPNLRFAIVENVSTAAPLRDFKKPVEWKVAAPTNLGEASAVCYYMARSLQKDLKIPVGFVSADWGGTTIQSWISPKSMGAIAGYGDQIRAVAELASSPVKAMAAEARRQEAWWDAHDPLAKAQRAWISPTSTTPVGQKLSVELLERLWNCRVCRFRWRGLVPDDRGAD